MPFDENENIVINWGTGFIEKLNSRKEAEERGLKEAGSGFGENINMAVYLLHKFLTHRDFVVAYSIDFDVKNEESKGSNKTTFWYDPKQVDGKIVEKRKLEIQNLPKND